MAGSQSANGLSKQMEKMNVSGKSRADAPRYTPPHRKYAQANKSSESSTTTPARVANQSPAPTLASTEKSVASETVASTRSEAVMESKTTPVAATDNASESKPEPKPATSRIAPHHKHTKPIVKVADSWEQEEEETLSEPEPPNTTSSNTSKPAIKSTEEPAPVPKSTYLPPHLKYRSAAPSPSSRSVTPPSRSTTPSSSTSSERRPEKTNAVAHRLIAGALGVKVPRRTEEQRAYDKSMREQEKRKRDQEREAKKKAEEDAAKAKAAIWDD
ncbi:unnamed protein product [Aureobasidium uvarum]|uniref:Uncharacterized protein n=1 Tax=Aureobasidium uvarum TaxID=2773716 RepID=A0A9N8KP17_9PEZI|nr:unnamed protein product [Aureobasidium uvarum]